MITLPVYTDSETVYVYDDVLFRRKNENNKVLQRSTDLGSSWTDLYTFTDNVGVVVRTANGNIIVSQDADGYWAEGSKATIWLSTNGGTTFSLVHTFEMGGVAQWSHDVKGNEVIFGEYGSYDSTKAYYSGDGGATWTTCFTNPATSGDIHIHKVLFDPYLDNTIYISGGDGTAPKGIWYTRNNGTDWTKITSSDQPTWMEVDETYAYFFGDLTGEIRRVQKTALFSGTFDINMVYTTRLDTEVDSAKVSFYGGRMVGSYIFAGGVAYGEDNTSGNNEDSALLVSWNQGANWRVVKSYTRNQSSSSGASFLSRPTSSGIIYVTTNNPNQVEILDTTREDFIALLTAIPLAPSTLTIKQG